MHRLAAVFALLQHATGIQDCKHRRAGHYTLLARPGRETPIANKRAMQRDGASSICAGPTRTAHQGVGEKLRQEHCPGTGPAGECYKAQR